MTFAEKKYLDEMALAFCVAVKKYGSSAILDMLVQSFPKRKDWVRDELLVFLGTIVPKAEFLKRLPTCKAGLKEWEDWMRNGSFLKGR